MLALGTMESYPAAASALDKPFFDQNIEFFSSDVGLTLKSVWHKAALTPQELKLVFG